MEEILGSPFIIYKNDMSKKYVLIIIGILLSTIVFMGYRQHQIQLEFNKAMQNYKAASDSLEIVELKNEKLLYEKNAYILKESELNSRINVTEQDLKEIKQQLKTSLDYINRIDGMVKIDTIHMKDTVYYKDSIPIIHFNYKDDWLNLDGMTSIHNNYPITTINDITVPLNLTTGISSNNTIFVKTDNPYVHINSIEGAIINDKKYKINYHHELQVGIGFQYGLFNKNIDFGPQIGYGFIIEF